MYPQSTPIRLGCSLLVSFFLTLALSTGCGAKINQAPMVAGQWRAVYNIDNFGSKVTGSESIVLNNDGKYKQQYMNDDGYTYEGDWNDWSVVQLPNGAYQLHLKGARFYPMGTQVAEALASGKKTIFLYDPATGKTESVQSEVVLNIEFAESLPHGIVLSHLPVGDLDSPQYVKFNLVDSIR